MPALAHDHDRAHAYVIVHYVHPKCWLSFSTGLHGLCLGATSGARTGRRHRTDRDLEHHVTRQPKSASITHHSIHCVCLYVTHTHQSMQPIILRARACALLAPLWSTAAQLVTLIQPCADERTTLIAGLMSTVWSCNCSDRVQ
jgi:hypothetical protein